MTLAEHVESLPTSAGVYLFKDSSGGVLYVGKAQNLRNRVRQYVSGGDGRFRIPALMDRATDVDVLVTLTVKDALLLENELIKQHKPVFNVRLRDDKQYLALRLDARETWPRITTVRRFRRDGAEYFGPYTSSIELKESLGDLRRIFPLRSCSEGVFKDYRRRGRPCIEYEMKRCVGPCCDLVDEAGYAELVHGTLLFLRGRSRELVEELGARMEAAAAGERFEEAARLRDRIAAVDRTLERQQIVSERPVDRDVFALAREGGEVELQVLHVREGRVMGAEGFAFSDVRIDDGEVMGSFLGQYYIAEPGGAGAGSGGAGRRVPREILTSEALEKEEFQALSGLLGERSEAPVALRAPQRGDPRRLVELAARNAELALARRLEERSSVESTLEELRERCALGRLPRRIECYDVSNLGGQLPVASRVVFEDGRPEKALYRRYRIREARGGDDYDCLREVLRRRVARREREPLPDLLMVDGGRGQLAVASAIFDDAGIELDQIGIAKERDLGSASLRVKRGGGLKAERLFRPGRANPLSLPPSSRGLLLLQRVRDESHRFAIEYQRQLRLKLSLTSILEELPGIGPGKRRALLRQLGSLRRIREAGEEELAAVTGVSRRDAQTIHAFFRAVREDSGKEEGAGQGE
ncbi:MAG: excinuclease ABC subunit UvrC [Deltaproteobacteria bacterium]|nr:excinuclease ABC subunit UvrC [Deltaproteobacteria bacterium]MBW2417677.1 excinuclease ABC subunit UvrC [Deltaproteobacteria bacterium]